MIDTQKVFTQLEGAGFSKEQAQTLTNIAREVQAATELVTKKDLEIALAPIRAQLSLHSWMLGLVVAGVAALLLKNFFGG
jgi:hypothetical protein